MQTHICSNKNMDYILYLMILPALMPIILLYFMSYQWFFSGGIYLIICVLLAIIFIIKYDTIILNQEKVNFSNHGIFIFFFSWFISFFYSLLSKYLTFQINANDSSIFLSMIYAINTGKIGYTTSLGIYHFALHQNYILLILALIHKVCFQSTIPIILCNSLSVIVASIFLYKISKIYFNQLFSIVIAFTFLASPFLSAYSGFYIEIYYVAALSILCYLILSGKKDLYIILATLFLLCIKEDSVLYILGFMYLLIKHKRYKLAALIFILAILIFCINMYLVAPYFIHQNLLLNYKRTIIFEYFTRWGTNYHDIINNIVINPIEFIIHCFDDNSGFWPNFQYWLFLPLLSPFVLLATMFNILLYTASDSSQHLHQMTNYHSFGIATLSFIGIILVADKIIIMLPKYKKIITNFFLYFVLMHNLLFLSNNWDERLNQANSFKDKLFLFSIAKLDFMWWRAFYNIDFKVVSDYYKTLNYLIDNHKTKPICIKGNIYNNFLTAKLTNITKKYDNEGQGDNIIDKNCVLVFSQDSQLFDNEAEKLQLLITNNKCVNNGRFYVCDK